MAPPLANNSGTRFWIKASPRGTRSGFAVLPDGAEGSVTVTVLPKPWATRARAVREYLHAPGTTTHVVMYETELLALTTSIASVGALTISLAAISGNQADLLKLEAPPKQQATAAVISGDPFGELIDLMLLAERGRIATSPLSFEGMLAPALLRLLAYERLVQVVEGVIFRARPRYAERTETLAIPRGRLSERGLLFSLKTGTPQLESTFDELTLDTHLLQVVASALRVVASERLPYKIAELRPALQTRAVHLLRHLSGVRLVERERAVIIAERLWLGQLDRFWEPALEAAIPVLRGRAIVPESGTESSEALLVHISTEKFWEECLELALKSAFPTLAVSRDAQPGEGVNVPAPWGLPICEEEASRLSEPESGSFPDFMFRASRRVAVADAKYKLGEGDAPSSQDGYQLFTYSHLAKLHGQTPDFALILCPTRAGGQPRQLRLERLRDRNFPLWLVRLPFPTRVDIQSQGNWSVFVEKLARTISDFSAEWVVQADAVTKRPV